jgi:signal recognition particle GTPase
MYIYWFTYKCNNGEGKFWSPYIEKIEQALLNYEVPNEIVLELLEELKNLSIGKKIRVNFKDRAEIYLERKKMEIG